MVEPLNYTLDSADLLIAAGWGTFDREDLPLQVYLAAERGVLPRFRIGWNPDRPDLMPSNVDRSLVPLAQRILATYRLRLGRRKLVQRGKTAQSTTTSEEKTT